MPPHRLTLRPLPLLLTALSFSALAQENSLPPTVVTAAPVKDAGSQAVPAQALKSLKSATSDTASLLANVPGVSLYGAGGVSSLPAIHGLADDRLRIKVDDMDILASCPNHMNPALSYIDPTNLAELKVYAGLSPVSVGGDSIGGSIVARSADPVFAGAGEAPLTKGEVGAFYRSNGNAVGGNLAATYATDSFNISYAGATAEADNYKAGGDFKTFTATGRPDHTLGLDEVGSTAYKTRNHSLGLAFRGDKQLVELKIGLQDLPYQLYPNQRMDMLDNQQKSINLRYQGQFGWGQLEARAYHEEVDHFMDFGADKKYWYYQGTPTYSGAPCNLTDPKCASGMPMFTASRTDGVSIKGNINLSERAVARIGAEYQSYRLNDWWTPSGANMAPGTFWNVNDGKRDRLAFFGERETQHSAEWMSLLGIRYERVTSDAGNVVGYSTAVGTPTLTDAAAFNARDRKKTDDNWDLTALATYTASPTQTIEFGFAHKTRSPNLYERYSWSSWQMAALMNNFVGDGNGYFGDIDLKPEQANTVSATFDWHAVDRSWEFKATPYYTRVDDYIDAVQWSGDSVTGTARTTLLTNQFTVLRYKNQTARLYGIDLSGFMPLGKTAYGDFGLKGMLSYTDGKNLTTGTGLYNIMPTHARLTLTQKSGAWDNAIELVLVDSKSEVSTTRNEIKTPAYQLVNLRGSYSWQKVRIDFGIENLFDENYALPLGGAYVGQGTTMSATATPYGIAVAGPGRSLYTGVNVKF